MTVVATVICLVIALVTAGLAGWRALRDQGITRAELVAAALVEVAVLLYVAVRVNDLAGGHRTSGLGLVVIYLIGLVLTVPVAAALSWAEPTRWGAVVLAVGALVVCVLFARINELWKPHG